MCSRKGKHGSTVGPVTPNASVRGIALSHSTSDSPDSARAISMVMGRPGAAAIIYGKFHVNDAIIQDQRVSLASKGKSLIGGARQGTLQGAREVGLRVLRHDIDVLRCSSSIA